MTMVLLGLWYAGTGSSFLAAGRFSMDAMLHYAASYIYIYSYMYPRGSKYPTLEVSGFKNHTLLMVFGTRVLKHWVLGPSGLHCNIAYCCITLY